MMIKRATDEAVSGARRILLSERDARRVLELLENPPRPAAALKAAAQRHVARLKAD